MGTQKKIWRPFTSFFWTPHYWHFFDNMIIKNYKVNTKIIEKCNREEGSNLVCYMFSTVLLSITSWIFPWNVSRITTFCKMTINAHHCHCNHFKQVRQHSQICLVRVARPTWFLLKNSSWRVSIYKNWKITKRQLHSHQSLVCNWNGHNFDFTQFQGPLIAPGLMVSSLEIAKFGLTCLKKCFINKTLLSGWAGWKEGILSY